MSMKPRYPDISVKLVGEDGNAFAIIGRVCTALRRGRVPPDKVEEFSREVTSGDYNNVLTTVMRWVSVT